MSQSILTHAFEPSFRRTPLPFAPVDEPSSDAHDLDDAEDDDAGPLPEERKRWSSTELAPRDASSPRLVALDGPLAGRALALGTPLLFGRGPYNHVVLDDVRISRQHAKIAKEHDGFTAQDLGSANGTFVNDERIERRTLAHGDVLRFGPFRFRFDAPVDVAPRVSQPPPASTLDELARVGRLEDANRKLHSLYGFVHAISPALRPSELLDRIAESLLEVFPHAAVAAVHTVDERATRMIAARVLARCAVAPELAPPALDAAASTSATELCVPMRHDGAAIGALHLVAEGGASFSDGDVDLLSALAVHGALKLVSARMHADALARERLAKDLALAEQIQRSFLPMALPSIDGVTFAVDYEPAHAVGGDFYDVFPQGPGRIGVIVGDVSGKGVSAALLMARVSSDLRAAMQRADGDPAIALDAVNKSICRRNQHDIFVTAVCISIDVPTRTLTIASAGHLPPYVRRDRERDVVRVDDAASMPLGLFEDVAYGSAKLTLGPRDTLVLCTDGVTEATSERSVQFGFEGMERSLRTSGSSPSEICDRLLAAVRAHVGAAPQYDDLTLVVLGMEDAEAMAA